MKDDPLKIEIVDEKLVISVGINTLCCAIEQEWGNNSQIINQENYIKDVIKALVREEEGDTPLTKMLSVAAKKAFSNEKRERKDDWWVLKNKDNENS